MVFLRAPRSTGLLRTFRSVASRVCESLHDGRRQGGQRPSAAPLAGKMPALLQPVVGAQDIAEAVVWDGFDAVAVDTGHGFSGDQRVDHRFLGRVNGGVE